MLFTAMLKGHHKKYILFML